MNNILTDYLPTLLGTVVLLSIAWGISWVLKFIVSKILRLLKINNARIQRSTGYFIYTLTFLLFAPEIMRVLRLESGVILTTAIVDYLPTIFATLVAFTFTWLTGAGIKFLLVMVFGKTKQIVTISNIIYVLVFLLLFIPMMLGIFNIFET